MGKLIYNIRRQIPNKHIPVISSGANSWSFQWKLRPPALALRKGL